jgi:nucleoid-associated protein YgaU
VHSESPQGHRAGRVLLVAGLLAIGVGLAWPFRHRCRLPADLAAADVAVVDVPLRRQDVALEVGPPSQHSPATPLNEDADAFASAHASHRPDLAALEPPPILPRDFGPALSTDEITIRRDWRPARLKLPENKPAQRRHRLTDGDSLQRLAERYLGNAARADEIFAINRDVLSAPDLLPLGKIIRIPPRETDSAGL